MEQQNIVDEQKIWLFAGIITIKHDLIITKSLPKFHVTCNIKVYPKINGVDFNKKYHIILLLLKCVGK